MIEGACGTTGLERSMCLCDSCSDARHNSTDAINTRRMTEGMAAVGKALGVSIEVRCGKGSRGECQATANGKKIDQPRTPGEMRKILKFADELVAVAIRAHIESGKK
jgi:hypothetical protein